MIDTVTHVLVFVDDYQFDKCQQQYTIALTFQLYDTFGIDDADVQRFGTGSRPWQDAKNARTAALAAAGAAVIAGPEAVAAALALAAEAQKGIDAAEGVTAWWQLQFIIRLRASHHQGYGEEDIHREHIGQRQRRQWAITTESPARDKSDLHVWNRIDLSIAKVRARTSR